MEKKNVISLGDLQRQEIDCPVLAFSTSCYVTDLSLFLDEIYSLRFERYCSELEVTMPSAGKNSARTVKLPLMHYDDLSTKIHYLLFDLSSVQMPGDAGFGIDKLLALDGFSCTQQAQRILDDLTLLQPKKIMPGDFLGRRREEYRQTLVREAIINVEGYYFENPMSSLNTTAQASASAKQRRHIDFMNRFVLNCLRSVDDAFQQQEEENEKNIGAISWW